MSLAAEICVIGGGPAGSTIARRLALLGHDICLLDRAAPPPPRVESLSPGLLHLLDLLELRDRVDAIAFLPDGESRVRWAGRDTLTQDLRPHVERGRFDRLLWDAARESGLRALRPAKVSRPRREADGWKIPVRCGSDSIEIEARFVVDAAGRGSVLGGGKRRSSAPTVALSGTWEDVPPDTLGTRLEAGRQEWLWGVPFPDGTFSATVFLEPGRSPLARDRGRESLYRSLLSRSSLLSGCLEGRLAGPVRVCDASSFVDDQPVGPGFLKVGESSFSVDPLSSQGLQAAVQSAVQGSLVIHTLRTCPEHAAEAIELYRTRQTEAVSRHAKLAARYYAEQSLVENHPFWRKRSAGATATPEPSFPPIAALDSDLCLKLEDRTQIVTTPCIRGDRIVPMRALAHPNLERPVAYLNDVEVAPLLDAFPQGEAASRILWSWTRHVSVQDGAAALRWMWEHGVIVPAPPSPAPPARRSSAH
ncbi:MAG TPA: tryptophan 7-halogenase [Thermoanaerobaculia bacterium]